MLRCDAAWSWLFVIEAGLYLLSAALFTACGTAYAARTTTRIPPLYPTLNPPLLLSCHPPTRVLCR